MIILPFLNLTKTTLSLLASMLWEICSHSILILLYEICHFSMAHFQIFFFNFQQFYHYVSKNRCFIISSGLGFAEYLKSMSLSLSPDLGSIQPIFIQMFALCHILSLLWDSDDINLRHLSTDPQVTKICVFSIFFSLLRFDHVYLYIFKFTDSFLCNFHSLWSHLVNFLFQYYFQFQNSHLVLLFTLYFLV